MESEKLQKWALVAEVVAAFAVVVTLGIVAFELNQSTRQQELNTNALEITAYQELINSIIEINSITITSPELREARFNSVEQPDSLTGDQRALLFAHYMNIIRHGDMAYFQYQRGVIDEARLDSALSILYNSLIENPIARERWKLGKDSLSNAYVEYVENMVPVF